MSTGEIRRRSKEHVLKINPWAFSTQLLGIKSFELRFDDRDYQVGDQLLLRETEFDSAEMSAGAPLAYTGREVRRRVTHILRGPVYGLESGWVIMSVVAVD